jgi:hypothetical protein
VSEALEAGLDVLLGHLPMLACRRVDAAGELALELAPPEGHAIVIRERARTLSVEFGGWVETLALDEGEWEPGEPEALVLDFAVAALLGDLHVEQIASRGLCGSTCCGCGSRARGGGTRRAGVDAGCSARARR